MFKVKTFQFPVSNYTGNYHYDCCKNHTTADYPICTEDDIDGCINEWIAAKKITVKNIDVVPYTVHRHNNSYADTVILVYTITYEV